MVIKVVAFDVYGTILASDDYDCSFRPRRGFYESVTKYRARGQLIVTASDVPINSQKRDLGSTFANWREVSGQDVSLALFDDFFQLVEMPKEFEMIRDCYGLKLDELFVFGDNYDKDILGAQTAGAKYYHVPEYRIMDRNGKLLPQDTFSFEGISLDD